MPVYGNTDINDIRVASQFRGFSFSQFKKIEVRNQLIDNLKRNRVEPACYWSAELICAGHFDDMWETIIHFFAKHIHLANPKLVVYLTMRYELFDNIVSQGLYTNILQLRNNKEIRRMFAEIVCILTFSPKKQGVEPIKINRIEEFDMTQMSDRLKATSVEFINPIWREEDPKELIIALNEFAFHVSPTQRNMNMACYWIEWIADFNIICNNRKEPTKCERRDYKVDIKYRREVIWLIWDVLLHFANETNNTMVIKIMKSTNQLFCANFTSGSVKKRRYLLYFAVSILTETPNFQRELIQDKRILETVVSQIDNIYKQVKENEHSPNTDYLFNNLNAESNFLKTIQKMEILNNL